MCCVTARDHPTHAARLDYLSSLAKEGWAWEYLRRNDSYRRAAKGHARTLEKVAEIGTAPVYPGTPMPCTMRFQCLPTGRARA
jgi:hypothetical protein